MIRDLSQIINIVMISEVMGKSGASVIVISFDFPIDETSFGLFL